MDNLRDALKDPNTGPLARYIIEEELKQTTTRESEMTKSDQRASAVAKVWYFIADKGIDPTQTDDYALHMVTAQVVPSFYRDASDNQWKLFVRDFHKRQQDDAAHRAHKAARAARAARRAG